VSQPPVGVAQLWIVRHHRALYDYHTHPCRGHSANRSRGFSCPAFPRGVCPAKHCRFQTLRQGVTDGIDYQIGSCVLVGGLFLFFFLTIRGGAPAGFIIVAAFPLVAGLLSLYFLGRKKPEATRAVAIKGIRFKIPELNGLPPEKQEEVLRRCLESEEFARKAGKIRLACLALTVVATIAVLNIFDWAGITGDQHWSSGVNVAVVIVFIPVMIFSQMWFRVRLIRKLVCREIANA
jgi:hypothetical protein